MQRLEVSGAVRHIYIYVIKLQRIKNRIDLVEVFCLGGGGGRRMG
jgi:hypothetical protein